MMLTDKVFKDIFSRNYRPLCLYAGRLLQDMDDAEDLVQDVFAKWLEHVRGKQTAEEDRMLANPRAYLYRMARNAALDRIRRQRPMDRDIDQIAEKLEYFFQPEQSRQSRIDRLIEAVDSLPDKARKVFFDIAVNGCRYQEVADEMGVSLNTVKTQFSRSLRLLRERLNKSDYEAFYTFFFVF